mgnify:CR=1 FL=1
MKSRKNINIVLAGVGGQGIISLGDIIAAIFLKAGYAVKKSELRGIAQRGGSVVSHLRAGTNLYSPLIPRGKVDALIALELLEAYRWLDYLKKEGVLFILDRVIPLSAFSSQSNRYPADVKSKIRARCKNIVMVSEDYISNDTATLQCANMFMLGVFSHYLPFAVRNWQQLIQHSFPRRLVAVNLRAFLRGRNKSIKDKRLLRM